jgi:hypothetical protein
MINANTCLRKSLRSVDLWRDTTSSNDKEMLNKDDTKFLKGLYVFFCNPVSFAIFTSTFNKLSRNWHGE